LRFWRVVRALWCCLKLEKEKFIYLDVIGAYLDQVN